MTTPTLRPRATATIGPLDEEVVDVPAHSVLHPAEQVFHEGFEGTVTIGTGGWEPWNPGELTVTTSDARTGAKSAHFQGTEYSGLDYNIDHLNLEGATVTLSLWVKGPVGHVVKPVWSNALDLTHLTDEEFLQLLADVPMTGEWIELSATGPVWDGADNWLSLVIFDSNYEAGEVFIDDVTITRHAWIENVPATYSTTPTIPVTEGSVTLDAMNAPYGTAELTVPLTDPSLAEQIDPRDGQRVVLTAGDDERGTSRTFDLGLRSREVDHKQKTIRLSLATDEAILQEYAPLSDIDLWDYRTSLRSVVNQVLGTCIPGASLEASPSPDADVTPRWEQENLILNPRGTVDAAGWASTGTGGATVTVGTIGTTIVREGADVQSALRLTFTTAATGSPALRYGDATTPKVTPGRLYTFSAFVRQTAGVAKTGRIILRWVSEAGTTIKDATVDTSLTDSAWVKMSVTGLAPAGAARAYLYAGILNGMPASSDLRVTAAVFAEGTKNDVWFDGDRTDDAIYTYDWTPDARTTPSVRVPVGGEIEPDSLVWPAGTTAWEFLQPLTAGAGLRLFCDEQRRWRLIDPAEYSVPGVVSLSPAVATEGTDLISRDDPEVYCTGVLVRYTWTDSQGVSRTRDDLAGTPGIVLTFEVSRPYPGAGVAAAILARRSGQGRVQEVTALARWGATPSQQANVSLPGALDQLGQVEAIEWGLSNGLMVVKTRALTDIIPGSINALTGTINALTGTINDL